MKDHLCYEDYGAIGDGTEDDFAAIYRTHEAANAANLPVRAREGATYLIRDTRIDGEVKTVKIRTDTTLTDATFIIDDTELSYYGEDRMARSNIIRIESEYEPISITDREILKALDGVGEGTGRLPVSFGYKAMLVIYNENRAVFRRYGGYAAKDGGPAKELLVIDAEGNIDPATPFMFDYETVTRLDVYRTDIPPLTLRGGKFITRARRENIFPRDEKTGERRVTGGYFARGIAICRSHTTLEGVEHYIEGEYTVKEQAELGVGSPLYGGFYNASYADGITLKDCVMTGRRCYARPNGGTGGTYGFSAAMVNRIRLVGCTQSNFYVDQTTGLRPTADSLPENIVYSMSKSSITGSMICWGLGGTNFCKNMEYIDCTLSRFDAHQGLYNGAIRNSTLSFMELTGKGEMLIEGMHWYSPGPGQTYNSLVYLRSDYGSTWDGTVIIKDTVAEASEGDFYIFSHNYANWDFGYKCHFPSLIIDNLEIRGLSEGARVHLVTEERSVGKEPSLHKPETECVPYVREDGAKEMINMNPIAPPRFVKVKNCPEGFKLTVTEGLDFFSDTEFIYE